MEQGLCAATPGTAGQEMKLEGSPGCEASGHIRLGLPSRAWEVHGMSEPEKGRMLVHLCCSENEAGSTQHGGGSPRQLRGMMAAEKRCLRVKHFNRLTGRWMKERPWETTFVKSTPALLGFP